MSLNEFLYGPGYIIAYKSRIFIGPFISDQAIERGEITAMGRGQSIYC